MAAGYLCRRMSLGWVGHVITALIWLLLFVLGLEVGANRRIMDSLVNLGGESLLVAAMCTLGNLIPNIRKTREMKRNKSNRIILIYKGL